MTKRDNQKSIYTEPDVHQAWLIFSTRYPRISFTDVANEAMREYFERCVHGVDGNLHPLPSNQKVREK